MAALPSGTVTFLFTDIEGSTKRWQQFPEAMAAAVARHDRLLRQAIEAHGGYVFKTVGDAFCATFQTAPAALAAALAAQRALFAEAWAETGPIRARMALHTGAAEERDNDYFGPAVNRAARLLSPGHGGQLLLSLPSAELVRDSLPEGASLRDMGEHRLKDLARAERVYQLVVPDLPADFAPLATLDYRPNNLPLQLTPFIGREREVATVTERLMRPDVRLLTLTGPGGTGKTRLSLQAAADLIDLFADGVFFVALDSVTDPTLLPGAVAQTLGVREAAGQPMLATLQEFLRGRELLLVLDNFEQLVGAAQTLPQLLQTCPRLKLLVSSRVRLQIHGEHTFAVPPLGLPDRDRLPSVEELGRYEAIRLFVERAQAAQSDFALTAANARPVAEICHGLDGLPLAIELAAARVGLLPPQAMLARLEKRLPLLVGGGRDRPERQQTLRGAIAWSHDLLKPVEQALFARLAVFAGGCTFDAVEEICDAAGDRRIDPLSGLDALVDNSLVRQLGLDGGEPRFAMLTTIREYGLEQLTARGEQGAVGDAHAAYFFDLAQDAMQRLHGPEQAAWLERLETEHDNFRAALDWLTQAGEVERHARLVNALAPFWWARGHLTEGRRRFEGVLGQAEAIPPSLRARTLGTAGGFAHYQGDYTQASVMHEQALALYQELGNKRGTAGTLVHLGSVATEQGEYDLAEGLYEDCLALYRELGDSRGACIGLGWLGELAVRRGDYQQASALYEEAIAGWRTLQDEQMVTVSLANLAEARQHQGDQEQAARLFHQTLPVFRTLGDRRGTAFVLFGLGNGALARADAVVARNLLTESLTLAQQVGDKAMIAGCLDSLAGVAATESDAARAARLLGAADALREAIGAPRQPAYQASYDQRLTAVRTTLGESAFLTVWQVGRNQTLEDATAQALAAPSAAASA